MMLLTSAKVHTYIHRLFMLTLSWLLHSIWFWHSSLHINTESTNTGWNKWKKLEIHCVLCRANAKDINTLQIILTLYFSSSSKKKFQKGGNNYSLHVELLTFSREMEGNTNERFHWDTSSPKKP
jgi:hypothetical protein